MGREMRRSQERAERRQKQREAQQPRRTSLPSISTSAPEAPRSGSFFKPRWALDIIAELKRLGLKAEPAKIAALLEEKRKHTT